MSFVGGRPLGALLALLLVLPAVAPGQRLDDVRAVVPRGASARVEAVRVDAEARLDGRLDDPFWSTAVPATGLRQREPVEGAPAPERTEVRFAFEDDALWIGARMFSDDPDRIRALVTRRDREGTSEEIVISLDTHLDRRTAYSFGATPAGVRVDYYVASDNEHDRDYGYDPVWELATSIDSLGWVAEMRIPFSQLRFNPEVSQTWGVNVVRHVPARNEESLWAFIGRNENGWASRMGTLAGLHDIRQSRRMELMPYLAADATVGREVDPRDPFARTRTAGARAGADLKLGLGPNITLDATINPDFGQVEADPAEVNLSAYETFFSERRPFFAEGSPLLGARNLFYSRRIGAPPPGRARGDFAEQLEHTTILGAAKLSGRLPSRLSIAALAAVTDRATVATFDTTTRRFGRDVVAPRSSYFVGAVQQELGSQASTIAATMTAMHRDMGAGSPLASLVSRDAFSGLLEGRWRWAEGEYDVNAYVGFADVRGDTGAIARLQRSSRRYWQRPDARETLYDSTRRELFGTMIGIGHSKMAGRHWRWDVDFTQESPGFEPNDMGAYGSVDRRRLGLRLRWNETRPSRLLRDYDLGLSHDAEWSFEGVERRRDLAAFANFTLPNYWELQLDGEVELPATSDRLTRGGPLMATPRGWGGQIELRNADGARHEWGIEAGVDRDAIGGSSLRLEWNFTARPGDRLEVRLDPRWEQGVDPRQFVDRIDGGRPETYGNRYVFAAVERYEVAARLRVNYTVTPELTLESYLEPFASSGIYRDFGELAAPGALALLDYGTRGTTIERLDDGGRRVTADGGTFEIESQDFNVRSLRSNVVLRWEWRAGSTLYAVWQQNRSADRDPRRVRPRALWDAFETAGESFFALKVSYWLPVP